ALDALTSVRHAVVERGPARGGHHGREARGRRVGSEAQVVAAGAVAPRVRADARDEALLRRLGPGADRARRTHAPLVARDAAPRVEVAPRTAESRRDRR